MIFGLSVRPVRHLLWLCAAFAGSLNFALAQPEAPGWGLVPLMHDLAQVRSASARFTERQTMHMLSAPLVSSGSLTYVAPDYVRKEIQSPAPENFVLDHGSVTITGGPDQQTHRFTLNDDPRIGGLVEAVRATLAGDLPGLEQFYTVRLSGGAANWQLLLRPKNPDAARFIQWIAIYGSGNRLTELDTASSDGDHSEMRVTEDASDAK
jgi:Outer membrane lipoprotein carrier protein LolA-like